MTKNSITPEVRRFVLTSIPSVPHMEALMLLWSSKPARWRAPDLARRLYISPPAALTVLDDLVKANILTREHDAFFYEADPGVNASSAIVELLALCYRNHLVEVTQLIHAKMDRKAFQFADAFNFRKEP